MVGKSARPCDGDGSEMYYVRQQLERFQDKLLRELSAGIEDVMQHMHRHELQRAEFRGFSQSRSQPVEQPQSPATRRAGEEQTQTPQQRQFANMWSNRVAQPQAAQLSNCNGTAAGGDSGAGRQRRPARTLPDKVFVERESYLTALLEVDHMKAIYHIFYIILLVFLLNSVCYDYFVEGRVIFGLGTFKSALAGIHYVFAIWLLEHVFVVCLYYAFKGWTHGRSKLRQAPLRRFWSHSCLIVYAAAQLVFGYVASAACLKLHLPYVSAIVLLMETIRLLMKMHAFVRTNAARVLAGKQKLDTTAATDTAPVPVVPPLSCYLYFLFAPTLIYRDYYPRTSRIRLRFALARFLEVVAVAFLYAYIHERHIRVHFVNYGLEPLNASALVVKLFAMLMPAVIIFLSGFYLLLHSWLNFTSELLRFGDRMFYKDWWTASTYDDYYRNWNIVVHDWLFEYIYKDCYAHLFRGSKLASSLTVFLVSAAVHEHILGFALQLFFPMMFLFFGVIGVSMVFLTRHAPKTLGNILLWFSLIFGNGLLISLYCMEYYAQRNCAKTYGTWADTFTPALWSCKY